MSRLRILVAGLVGQYPLGGMAWVYGQYLLGLARLGHDVYYVEETNQWPYDPVGAGRDLTFAHNHSYLARSMQRFGMTGRWAYRVMSADHWAGMSDRRREHLIKTADLVLNVSGALAFPERYRAARMAYIDTDPVFTQVRVAAGQEELRRRLDAHDVHFGYAERWPTDLPVTGHRWRPLRPPVVLDEWRPNGTSYERRFTTVMNWTSYKPVVHAGRTFGQKDVELGRFLGLPPIVRPTVLELALSVGKTRRPPRELLEHRGWTVVEAARACGDPDDYRSYIRSSPAEWSVAKHGYVAGRAGWFSDRSACYLAAGRPVVVQDTGVTEVPRGEGLLTFADIDQAAAAIHEVHSDPERHAGAAHALAEEYFASERVLTRLVEEALSDA